MRPHVRVIADDLTGAADAGVTFARNTQPVELVLDPRHPHWAAPRRRVTVVDTSARDGDAVAARAVVSELAGRVGDGDLVLKKIDSTLRGHVAAELHALRDRVPGRLAILAPAFPAAGRTTLGAVQHVHGVPVHRSGTWAIERCRAPASLPALLDGMPFTTIALPDVRGQALPRLFDTAADRERLAICDAEHDGDLDAIVAAGWATGRRILWVGSAGLAAALARRLCDSPTPGTHAPVPQAAASPGPAIRGRARPPLARYLAVVGSAAPTARRQAAALAAAGAAAVRIPAALLLRDEQHVRSDLTARVLAASGRGDAVVSVSGEVDPARAPAVCRTLATVVAPAAARVSLLVLTGGATARAVLTECRITAIELRAELAPGVVLATSAGTAPIEIITKAGAFGDERTLVRAVRDAAHQRGTR